MYIQFCGRLSFNIRSLQTIMSTTTDSHSPRSVLSDAAFWFILTLLILLVALASTILCAGPLSSNVDAAICAGVTYALAVFLVAIGTIYATLANRDVGEACLLINLAGIALGWPTFHIRE